MKTLKTLIGTLFVVLAMGSCTSTQYVPSSQLADKWVLKSINNRNATDAFSQTIPYITFNFDDNQVSGNAGCNAFSGKFSYIDGNFSAPNLVSTQMACTGTNEEDLFLRLLRNPSYLTMVNGDLIFSQNANSVLVFSRAQGLSTNDLSGTWELETMEGRSTDLDSFQHTPTLEFNFSDGRISGNAGCNQFNASFTLNNNTLDVQPLATTRMACDKMEGENKFSGLLAGRSTIDFENNLLILRRNNNMIMTFKRK
ncbi:MAG: META domain-containing protein [Candidatus Azobacteroides sp.]|nr:META domain-containing protein [Candidatus Azobacteroides sp.]